jgi:hypothetical protein
MMRTLFQAGFHGPMAIEKLEGRDNVGRMPVELIDERAATAYKLLAGMMERTATAR